MRLPRLGMMVVAVSAAALIFAGCGSGGDVRDMEPAHGPHLSLVRAALGEPDLNPASYPAEIVKLRGAKEIVTGSVEGIEQGRRIYLKGTPRDSQTPLRMIVLQVRVSNVLLDNLPGAVQDGRVYVELFQGANTHDGSAYYPLSVWRKAIPVGTKTILFLYESTWTLQASDTVDDGQGRPGGAKLLEADPQGMLFEFDGQLLSADDGGEGGGVDPWGMHSIDEVAQNVKDRL